MKKSITRIILILIVVLFGGAMYYLYQKNSEDPVVYETEQASKKTIVKKTVATGSILPLEEVLIKPNISGVVISQADLDRAQVAYDQAKQTYRAANKRFEIVNTGTTKGFGNAANTQIRATVSGMVLEVPVEVGNQVIEANNFNEGTTIAAIADVEKMIFEGKVDESEVGKIKEELPLEITVGAIENTVFDAVLDYIAPKGKEENGAIQFEIKGTMKKQDSVFIRAGLSANASIILAKVDSVLAVKEALVQFDDETKEPYVEIATGEQEFERKDIDLGVSDGIFVEVKSGITMEDKIKVWNKIENEEEGN